MMKVIDALVKTGLCKTKNEARRLIEQGGAKIEGMKVTDVNAEFFIRKNKVILVQNHGPIQFKNTGERGKSKAKISLVRPRRFGDKNDKENQEEDC